MGVALYDLSVASYLQTLGGVSAYLERALGHFRDNGINPDEVVDSRIWDDMLPFRFQIVSVVHHSRGAIEGLKSGEFTPPSDQRPHDFAGLQGIVAEARDALGALSRDEVNALEGRDVAFKFRDFRIPYTAENFVMSFSLPNFYFHAATAYDILRSKGAPLGKRDFMGQMRTKAG